MIVNRSQAFGIWPKPNKKESSSFVDVIVKGYVLLNN